MVAFADSCGMNTPTMAHFKLLHDTNQLTKFLKIKQSALMRQYRLGPLLPIKTDARELKAPLERAQITT